MIVVTGIAEVSAGSLERVREAARVMAKASRAEPGCRAYAFYEDIEQPGRFRIYEEWESADALRAHFGTSHMAAFRAVLGASDIATLNIDQFERGPDIKVGGAAG